MNLMDYDSDSLSGLMPQILALTAPPGSRDSFQQQQNSSSSNCNSYITRDNGLAKSAAEGGLAAHPYFKRPGKGHNHDCCDACSEGGDLICCDFCPASFHLTCHDPPLSEEELPTGDWACHQCRMGGGEEKISTLLNNNNVNSASGKSTKFPKILKKKDKTKAEEDAKVYAGGREMTISNTPLATLIRAVAVMNPTQFTLPYEMTLPSCFPGEPKDTMKKYGSRRGGTRKKPYELDNGVVPLPAKLCFLCNKSCRLGPMVPCDYCPLFFHLDCLDPPLATPPMTLWMCPNHPEHHMDMALLTSHSLTQRVKLWDKFSTPLDQDSIKLSFFHRCHRVNPPFRFKVKKALRSRIRVPGIIKTHYKDPPDLMPHLSPSAYLPLLLPHEEEFSYGVSSCSINARTRKKPLMLPLSAANTNCKSWSDDSSRCSSHCEPRTEEMKAASNEAKVPSAHVESEEACHSLSPESSNSSKDKLSKEDQGDSGTSMENISQISSQETLPEEKQEFNLLEGYDDIKKDASTERNPAVISEVNLRNKNEFPDYATQFCETKKEFQTSNSNCPSPTRTVSPEDKDVAVTNHWVSDHQEGLTDDYSFTPTEEEKNEWLTGLLKMQSSIFKHLSNGPLNEFASNKSSSISPTTLPNSNTEVGPDDVSSSAMFNGYHSPEFTADERSLDSCDQVLNRSIPDDVCKSSKATKNCVKNRKKSSTRRKKISQVDILADTLVNLENVLQKRVKDECDIPLSSLDKSVVDVLAYERLKQLLEPHQPRVVKSTPDVAARALLFPLVADVRVKDFVPKKCKYSSDPVSMKFRVLTIGKGSQNQVNLDLYGHCNFISTRHASIIFDEASGYYELINYSEYSSKVDGVTYHSEFYEGTVSQNSTPSILQQVREIIAKRREEALADSSRSFSHKAMSSRPGEDFVRCECRCWNGFSDKYSTLDSGDSGWEGAAVLHHGSYIRFGCLKFVFSIVEEASKGDWMRDTLSIYHKFIVDEISSSSEEEETNSDKRDKGEEAEVDLAKEEESGNGNKRVLRGTTDRDDRDLIGNSNCSSKKTKREPPFSDKDDLKKKLRREDGERENSDGLVNATKKTKREQVKQNHTNGSLVRKVASKREGAIDRGNNSKKQRGVKDNCNNNNKVSTKNTS